MSEKQQGSDHADVVLRPPFVYASAMIVATGLHHFHGWPIGGGDMLNYIGGAVLLLSVVLIVSSLRPFIAGQQNPDPLEPTGEIYQSGLYALSRNPMYVGFTFFLAGLAFTLDNFWMVLSLIPVVIFMTYGVIKREEAYLERCFGEEYTAYRAKIRRWF